MLWTLSQQAAIRKTMIENRLQESLLLLAHSHDLTHEMRVQAAQFMIVSSRNTFIHPGCPHLHCVQLQDLLQDKDSRKSMSSGSSGSHFQEAMLVKFLRVMLALEGRTACGTGY